MVPLPSLDRRKVLLGALGTLTGGALAVGSASHFRHAAAQAGLKSLTRAGVAFQTPVALTVAGSEEGALDKAMKAAFAAIRAVENASSVYRPQSDLSRLNRIGHIEAPSPHLVTLVRYALKLSEETDGAFDPTVQPLWDIWAVHARNGVRPSDEDLGAVVRRIDWRRVDLSDDHIRFAGPDMAMTLNSINQGYAADVVMAVLREHDIVDAFVDTGEFGATGRHPDGRDWRLAVVAPRETSADALMFDPFKRFAATSGDYKTFFSPDFRDHHIFDPRTGRSPPNWSSITVSASSGLEADGLSTALFVSDASACARLMNVHCEAQAWFFDKAGREVGLEVLKNKHALPETRA